MAELGEHGVGHKMWFGPTLWVQCALGRIEANVSGDAGVYDEIEVNLIADDGRVLQLARIGCTENDAGLEKCGGDPEAYALVWDGLHEPPIYRRSIDVRDESYWYEAF